MPIEGARVSLIFQNGDTIANETDSNGFFSFQTGSDWIYNILVQKKLYFYGKGQENGPKPEESTVFYHIYELKSSVCDIKRFPKVYFQENSAEFAIQADSVLQFLKQVMLDNPRLIIGINGLRDVGEDISLACLRAEKVRNWFVTKGIHPDRLQIDTHSDLLVIDPKFSTKEDWEKHRYLNRCCEFWVASDEYEPND